MTVGAEEFIRRFLQHALPAGVHKVRYYGLWSPSNRKKLLELQQTLTQSGNDQPEGFEEDIDEEISHPSGPQTMSPLPEGHARPDRAPASPREGTTVRELILISLMIKFNPKHDPSVDMTIPFCLYVEKPPQIGHRLRLISLRWHQTDQPIPYRARSNRTNPSADHR